jgi:hypothetical protein
MSASLNNYFDAHPGRVIAMGAVVLAVLWVLWTKHRWDTEAQRRAWWRDLEMHGVVKRTEHFPLNHDERHVFIQTDGAEIDLTDPIFHHSLSVGDSIYKSPGEGVAYYQKLDGARGQIELFKNEQTLFLSD